MTQKWSESIIEEYSKAGFKFKNSKKDIKDIYKLFLIQDNNLRANLEYD